MSAHRKSASIQGQRGDGTPDAAAMAVINRHTLRELAAEDVYARECIVAHNGIDRDRETLSTSLLDAFARTLPGKGFFVSHPGGWNGEGGPGEGRWFAARTERMPIEQARVELGDPTLKWPSDTSEAVLLRASFYLPRKTAPALVEKIDAGVARDISIQFTAKVTDEHREDDRLVWRRLDMPGEALEASLVWLGAQPGARVTKSARTEHDHEDTEMSDELKAKLKAAEVARDAAITDAGKAKAAADRMEALRKALGDDAGVLDDAEGAAALIKSGQAHRKGLVDAIVAAERQMGLVGDDEAAVKSAGETYALLPTAKLQALHDRYKAAGAAGGGAGAGQQGSAIAGGDPNAGTPGSGTGVPPGTHGKATGFLANPAITGVAA